MIRDMIMQMASKDPSLTQGVDAMEAQLQRTPIVPEDMDEAVKLLEYVIQNPDKYKAIRDAAIKDGLIDESTFPPEYDQTVVVSLLIAMYGLQDRLKQRGFSRGGLSVAGRRLMTGGQGGDTMLAHINPREAEVLRRMGGQGSINPNTGLREYKGLKKILGAVLPIALSIFAPGIGTAISGFLAPMFGAASGIAGGALMGAASSKLTGGNVLQGALLGGAGAGLGSTIGKTLAPSLSGTAQNMIGSGLIGGVAGQSTGQGFLKGAAMGAAGAGLSGAVNSADLGNGAFQAGVQGGVQNAGNMLAAGYDPKSALTGGALAGIATGLNYKVPKTGFEDVLKDPSTLKPGESVVKNIADLKATGSDPWTVGNAGTGAPVTAADPWTVGNAGTGNASGVASPDFNTPYQLPTVSGNSPSANIAPSAGTAAAPALKGMGALGYAGLALAGASLLKSAPPAVQEAVSSLSPAQQEYFNRPSTPWDWNRIQTEANNANVSLADFMSSNWNKLSSGVYNQAPSTPATPTVQKAMGGPLGQLSRFAKGAGSGRADTINAKLSDGEYVMDAETVAMLGDGSSEEGAKRLDQMRANLREHKGKALAKGKFSPDAKSPLAYLKGVA